ncbi:S-adenosyl-L-methionine-dependent methyltransferase [Aspergillus sergii]|uniref:S-adenosyl-L-methionine-dependent methyltransferase n=1 Tax=Aspergillus sergii TaxID=1034303 RepID=A0A5N6X5G2_9EURO|nr:S-adenosyl-L-methionine-dependent methyltransferase [Aspergillus sergii]
MSKYPKPPGDLLSLTDSVPGYLIEDGRRYQKYLEGAYVFPNDEQELNRLDMQHNMLKLVNNGRLYFAPLQDPKEMLDIGTGSGIWPIEMAALFPNAEIIGTDLSPIQPTVVPENVRFLVDDAAEDNWLWEPDYFDYIRLAHLTGAMPSFKELLRNSLHHLKPGGWLECHEMDPKPMCDDGTMPPENEEGGRSAFALHDWWRAQHRSGQFTNPPRQFRIAHRIERSMRESGFVDIQQRIKKVPTNPWPSDPEMKEIGSRSERNWLEALSGWSYKPLASLGWTRPEIEVFLVDVRKAIQNRDVHCYMNFHVVTGRKPLPDEKKASRGSHIP